MKSNQLLCCGLLSMFACANVNAQVVVALNNDEVTIGNEHLSRTFKIANNKLLPQNFKNKRATGGAVLVPGSGSEEFILHYVADIPSSAVYTGIDRTGWTAVANSHEVRNENGNVNNLLDGKLNTFWHSRYSSDMPTPPHWVQIDMKKERVIRSFSWVQRQNADNGMFEQVKVYLSSKSDNIESAENLIYEGMLETAKDVEWVNLDKEEKGRYLRIVAKRSLNGFGSGAELYVGDKPVYNSNPNYVNASDLTLKSVKTEDIENGKRLVFDMAPYRKANIDWDIDMVVEMKNTDNFMRKYLRISVPESQQNDARIDYIDMENINVEEVPAAYKWTHSLTPTVVGGLNSYLVTLGQPLYIQGMFMGSEFPETENVIKKGSAYVRYYSGKSLAELKNEGRLLDNTFTTWKNVLGATRSVTDMNVIRTDFFSYIQSIAKPIQPRLQYNSWYDWMLWVDDEKINNSFKEIERGLTTHGVRPIDSYVVDDGWNAYGNEFGCTIEDNTTGFWQFNSKFPNGLGGASSYAHRVSSEFGIWLGPRGGYNFQGSWGQFLEKSGTGTYNKNVGSVVTNDKVYLQNLEKFFLQCQKEYGVNYWKLDGFIDGIPQPSTNGHYITGGYHGMYYITEHWERWAKLLEHLYEKSPNLWINLTCYVNPSPWLLQYSNSIWLQNSADCSLINVEGRNRDMDAKLTYRDDRYFDFCNVSQYQLPPANIFNHDPVYGKEAGNDMNSMTDDEFRTYLYFMSTRGTAFWEMLWSYDLIDGGNKWMINADALQFLEENYDILRYSILFGGSPKDGDVYGYSCWNHKDGIIAVRNPSNTTKTFKFTLNNTLGVYETAKGLHRNLVLSYDGTPKNARALDYGNPDATYSYGDEISVTLRGGEVLMWKFNSQKDTKAPAVVKVTANGKKGNIVEVVFDEPVKLPEAKAIALLKDGRHVAGAKQVELMPDYKTLVVKVDSELSAEDGYTVQLDRVADWQSNNAQLTTPMFYYNKDALLLSASSKKDFVKGKRIKSVSEGKGELMSMNKAYQLNAKKSVLGKGSFNVALNVKTTAKEGNLVAQENAFVLKLKNGHPVFNVMGLEVVATTAVNDGKLHVLSVCRENNGMLKIYIDGELNQSVYSKDNVNPALQEGALVVGDKNAEMQVGNIRVHSKALNFKEVGKL